MKTFIILDLETSGLDPEQDRIVEIGWMYADHHMNRINTTSHTPVRPVGNALTRIYSTPEVLNMHTRTGLLNELRSNPELPLLAAVENSIVGELDTIDEQYRAFRSTLSAEEQLAPSVTEHMEFVLTGKNVHFDKSFIDRYMPRLSKRLSHRTFDYTTLKYALEIKHVGMNVVMDLPHAHGLMQHRAGYDVEECFSSMRFMLEQLNVSPEAVGGTYALDSTFGTAIRLDVSDELDADLRALNGEE